MSEEGMNENELVEVVAVAMWRAGFDAEFGHPSGTVTDLKGYWRTRATAVRAWGGETGA